MTERVAGTLLDPKELLSNQTGVLETFFGQEAIPEPPKALLEFVEITAELGFTFEPYFEPRVVFTQDSNYPGWVVKPNPWLFDQIRKDNISPDAVALTGQWAAMEGFAKPEYADGKQLYANDPLTGILEKLRKDKKIEVPDRCSHIPTISRFGTSPDEIDNYIVPVFTDLSQIENQIKAGNAKAGTPSYMVFNYRGNTAHPEWGQTNTSEWFANEFGDGSRLFGGGRDFGGLARVDYFWHGDHYGSVGFRLHVAFPSSKS